MLFSVHNTRHCVRVPCVRTMVYVYGYSNQGMSFNHSALLILQEKCQFFASLMKQEQTMFNDLRLDMVFAWFNWVSHRAQKSKSS